MLSAKVVLPSTETLGSGECLKMNWMWSLLTFSPHLYMSQLISLKDEIIISNITLVAEAAAPRPPTDTSVGRSEIKPNPKESHQSWCFSANTKFTISCLHKKSAWSSSICSAWSFIVWSCEASDYWIHQLKRSVHLIPASVPVRVYIYLLKRSTASVLANYKERERQDLKAQTINFPGERVHSAWRARVTFHWQDWSSGDKSGGQMRY